MRSLLLAALFLAAPPDYVASLVGKTFLRALTDRDAATAASLCASSLNLDGRTIEGPKAVRRAIEDIVARMPQGYRFELSVVLRLPEAVRRFGPLPRRLGNLARPDVVVVFGKLPRRGLAVFVRKIRGTWKVVGLTD